jgi:hypothetical protein
LLRCQGHHGVGHFSVSVVTLGAGAGEYDSEVRRFWRRCEACRAHGLTITSADRPVDGPRVPRRFRPKLRWSFGAAKVRPRVTPVSARHSRGTVPTHGHRDPGSCANT